MALSAEHLYNLLPAVYRIRDAERGEPLKGLIAVLAEQGIILENDIAQLYENWFIETCDEWAVPYIGDLLAARNLYEIDRLHSVNEEVVFSRRARVANTLAYRRRKGTATMLEQLARDTTGWNARAVEFFELLGWTQNVNHLRPDGHSTLDLRKVDSLELLNGPFDTAGHTVDVRRVDSGRGRHNIPNVGIFLWRLQSYHLREATARPAITPADGRYRFDQLGRDLPLFNRPQTEAEITHLAEEHNVPEPLRRLPLYRELEARRQAIADNRPFTEIRFGIEPVLQVFTQAAPGDPFDEIPPERILICNLSDPPAPIPEVWRRPPTDVEYALSDGSGTVLLPIDVAVDPELGRIAFPEGVIPNDVRVSYAYGFSGDVGGGPYDRRDSLDVLKDRPATWQVGVAKEPPTDGGTFFTTIADAIAAWNALPAGTAGTIVLTDNASYAENLTGGSVIRIPEGSRLLIVAGTWPLEGDPEARVAGRVEPDERRPHLLGNLSVEGTAPAASLTPGELIVNGLLIEGTVRVLAGNLGRFRLTHSTIAPGIGSLRAATGNEGLRIEVLRSITGEIRLTTNARELTVQESIVDNGTDPAIAAAETAVKITRSTIIGDVQALRLDADTTIFTEPVEATRRQIGCVRFSYLPNGSLVARRFRCQPDLALTERARELGKETPDKLPLAERRNILARIAPLFTSESYGNPAYGQLSLACVQEIREGGADGGEMGAFNFLNGVQRETNLRASIDEYLRFGLNAGLFFVT